MTPTLRRLAIVRALEMATWSRAADLGKRLNVSADTVYRDMQALQADGVPVVGVRGRGFRLLEGYFLPPVTLTQDQAVLVLASAPDDAPGLAYRAAAHAVGEKLRAALPEERHADVDRVRARLRLVAPNVMDDPKKLEMRALIHRALEENLSIRLSTGDETHTVDPYGMIDVAGFPHLVARAREKGGVRQWPIGALKSVRLLRQTFVRPKGYDQRAGGDAAWVAVRVWFGARAAAWLREAPPAFVAEVEPESGGLQATLHVCREEEVLPWLLSWGSHVEVLGPPSLRRRMAAEAYVQLSRHGAGPSLFGWTP